MSTRLEKFEKFLLGITTGFILIVQINIVESTTYYVAKNGSDSNSGTTEAQPWLTIQKAANIMQQGDTTYVGAGIYRENVYLGINGTDTAPITLKTYGNDEVIISASDVVTGWSLTGGQTYTYQVTTTLQANKVWENITTVYSSKTSIAKVEASANSFYKTGNTLYIHTSDGTNPDTSGKTIDAPRENYSIRVGASYIIVDGFKTRNGYYGIYVSGSGNTGNNQITNCTFIAHSRGIALIASNNNQITNCISMYSNFYGVSGVGYDAGFYAANANNNIFNHCVSINGGGFVVSGGSTGTTIKNSIVLNSTSIALDVEADSVSRTIIDYNDWYKTSGDLIKLGDTTYTTSQFSNYKSAIGQAHSISADPKFISTSLGSEDFHLQAVENGYPVDSPCIGAGETLGEDIGVYDIYTDYNKHGIGSITAPVGIQSKETTITYTLICPTGLPGDVIIEYSKDYSKDGGNTWKIATRNRGEGTTNLSASPTGISHTFIWNTAYDLGKTNNTNVKVRVKASDNPNYNTGIVGQYNIQIKSFDSSKLLYDFNEPVRLYGIVVNNDKYTQNFKLELWIKKGIDKEFLIEKSSLSLPAGVEKKIYFTWDPKNNEYGYAAYLLLKTIKDELLAVFPPVVFEVCHDWRKICRMGSVLTYDGTFEQDDNRIDGIVKQFRNLYLNNIEVYGEWGPTIDNLTPKDEVWSHCLSSYPFSKPSSRQKYKISKSKTKEFIKKFHENGIKVIGYTHTPRYPIRDDTWIVYDPSTGKEMDLFQEENSEEHFKWVKEQKIFVPNVLKWKDDFSRKLVASIKEYDWDGWFLDSFQQICKATVLGVDKDGQRFTDLTGDEVYTETIKTLRDETKKVKDNFVLVPSGLHYILFGIELIPSRDIFGENLEKFPYPKGKEYVDVWFSEADLRDPVRVNTPWQLGRSLRAVREATKIPVWALVYYISRINEEKRCDIQTIKPIMALILSNGIGYWDYFGGIWLPSPAQDAIANASASYLKFACRYGQYLYDLDIQWTPKDMVIVDAPNHVYWKGNSFQREFKNYQEVYVHLINLDKHYLQAKLLDTSHNVPEKVKNIKVKIDIPSKYKKVTAYNLNADKDQEPEELKVLVNEGKAEVIVPYLEYWNLVIVRME